MTSTGDPKVDAYRDTLINGGDPKWRPIFRHLLADIRVDPRQIARFDAMRAIDTPAEYLDFYLTPERIAKGRALYRKMGGKGASQADGTPLELQLALWGALSDYGRRRDMDALTAMVTLAAYDRLHFPTFFPIHEAAQLMIERRIDRAKFRGYDSGRIGDIQYTPDFLERLGRDGNGDGVIDVWNSRADILANFWLDRATMDGPFVTAVKPHHYDPSNPRDARILQTIGNQSMAVTYFERWDGKAWTARDARYSAIYFEPFGKNGPAYLFSMVAMPAAARNPYNRGYDYKVEDGFTLAIGLLGEAIAGRPVHVPKR